MSSLVAQKSQPSTLSNPENVNCNDNSIEDQDDPETLNSVTSHVYLKPAQSNGKLDREVVLRRIRQRKRVNKIRAALQGLFGLPVSPKTDKTSIKWVDNAFAAP